MTPDKVYVTLSGLAAIAFIVWFFWMGKRGGIKAGVTSSGYQEVMVLVKGGYTPDKIVVERSKTLRRPGEYEFSCQMGMFRGKLIVE